jgi:hypothetical protein
MHKDRDSTPAPKKQTTTQMKTPNKTKQKQTKQPKKERSSGNKTEI